MAKRLPRITYDEIIEIFGEACKATEKNGETIISDGGIKHTIYLIEQEKNVLDQASIAMYEIAKNHFFSDKNKTTAILATELVLNRGGYKLKSPTSRVTLTMLLGIARGKKTKKEVKYWIEKHAIKLVKD